MNSRALSIKRILSIKYKIECIAIILFEDYYMTSVGCGEYNILDRAKWMTGIMVFDVRRLGLQRS